MDLRTPTPADLERVRALAAADYARYDWSMEDMPMVLAGCAKALGLRLTREQKREVLAAISPFV